MRRAPLALMGLLAAFAALSTCARAQDVAQRSGGGNLQLVPEPKNIERQPGEFVLPPHTRIVIESGEDEVAAQTLADEIKERGGSARISRGGSALRTPAIYLLRAASARARGALTQTGLRLDPDFDPQGYVLSASKGRIIVGARSAEGLFYGAQTLRQLIAERGHALVCPGVRIRDWPSLRWRGVHIDLSRGPVPTLATMKQQIRLLSSYKVNLYALYIEHIFDYQSQPLAAPREGALTAAEIRELVTYAGRYHVTVLPEQQAFGHLHGILKYDIYSDLAEVPHGFVLTPTNPRSYDLIGSLYSEIVPLFPSALFHIGGDETFELGTGQTKARAQEVGLGRVYLEHLQRVYQLLKPYHKRLMFWGDIAVKYPQLLSILPKDMIAVPWNYDAEPTFDKLIEPFRAAGLDVFIAPGANNWSAIFPNLDVAYVNIRNFVRDGQKHQAIGMLNTTWNDDGESLLNMSWPALLFGAAAGWQPGESSAAAFQERYDWAFYRNSDQSFAGVVSHLTRAESLMARARLDSTSDAAFWRDSFTAEGARQAQAAQPITRELRLAAEQALIALSRNQGKAKANAGTLDDLTFAALRYDLLGMKWEYAAEINRAYWDAYQNLGDRERVSRDLEQITGLDGLRLEDLRDGTTRLRNMYAELWERENRPYWLANVLVRYDVMAQSLQRKIEQVRAAHAQFEREGTLPAPEQLGFFWKP